MVKKQIAAITTVRNDALFLPKWIAHYGAAFGFQNLYVFLDGFDQLRPDCPGAEQVNFIHLPHKPLERVPAMRRRARTMSDLARGLFHYFDIVLATDVDEFLINDPNTGVDLNAYLSAIEGRKSVSGLGLDVGQHMELEEPLDPDRAFLDQRRFAHLSSRYTKPVVTFRPLTWGSGMHRIKRHGFHIDPNLYVFHFGMVDYQRATGKTLDRDRLATGWGGHLERREALFGIITGANPVDGDTLFPAARRYQSRHRPLYALNKPGQMGGDPVVEIPSRFRSLI
ncbi:MAG: glycosyltransferase family 2 protein [Rhodobacteraceae bacterium]|nr:glycosyltransferase family 2 protein [Paracoccaceae bacterium]